MAGPRDHEPLLDVHDIQGNSLAGFRKDHQRFLFFAMDPTPEGLVGTRDWLRALAPRVSSVAEVHTFNALFRSVQSRRRALTDRRDEDPPGLSATWLNVALSANALRRLTSEADVEQFTDPHFKNGLARTALLLNDPLDAEGRTMGWKVGGHDNEADILVIVASDAAADANARVARIHQLIAAAGGSHGVAPLTLIWDQVCDVLPRPLRGHEHFGFKDGISQPGVRGRVRANPIEFLTESIFDEEVRQDDSQRPEFSRPGQPLVWPGQFVFGYQGQSTRDPRKPFVPDPQAAATTPAWGRNGSYVVVRRLRQDVNAFRSFMTREAALLSATPGFSGMTPLALAAKLVGRWPSGAPVMRVPDGDDPQLGADAHANNFFVYSDHSLPPMPLAPGQEYEGDAFPLSIADPGGSRCPLSAHVRKVNTRDGVTEQGSAHDVLTRLVLRRGIPFGEAYDAADPATRDSPDHDRGLMFVSYQTSIDAQFVFLQKNWVNDPINPNNGGGEDGIIGQGTEPGRVRTVTVEASTNQRAVLTLDREWVIPTGGGFFFSPSISALATVLGTPRV